MCVCAYYLLFVLFQSVDAGDLFVCIFMRHVSYYNASVQVCTHPLYVHFLTSKHQWWWWWWNFDQLFKMNIHEFIHSLKVLIDDVWSWECLLTQVCKPETFEWTFSFDGIHDKEFRLDDEEILTLKKWYLWIFMTTLLHGIDHKEAISLPFYLYCKAIAALFFIPYRCPIWAHLA